jgi:hypothetical protein
MCVYRGVEGNQIDQECFLFFSKNAQNTANERQLKIHHTNIDMQIAKKCVPNLSMK